MKLFPGSVIDHEFPLLFQVPGEGAGGGGTPTVGGTPSGTPSGADAGSNNQGGGGGTGGGTPFRLSDDAMVDPGDGKPIRYSEYKSRFVPREEHEQMVERFNKGRDFLIGEAQKLEQAWQRFHAGQGPRPQERRPSAKELLNEVRQMSVLDGNTAAQLIEDLQQNGLGPIANLVAQLVQQNKSLREEFDGFRTRTAPLAERYQNDEFDTHVTKHLKAIPEVKGLRIPPGTDITQDPIIREIARDVWLSYDQSSWKDADYQTEIRKRIEGMVDFVRKLDRAYTEHKKDETRRRFANPNRGGGSPGGRPAYKFQTGTELARQLFRPEGEE